MRRHLPFARGLRGVLAALAFGLGGLGTSAEPGEAPWRAYPEFAEVADLAAAGSRPSSTLVDRLGALPDEGRFTVLLQWVRAGVPDEERLSADDRYLLRHHLMMCSRVHSLDLPRTARCYAEVARDATAPEVIRDYAVQHLSVMPEENGWDAPSCARLLKEGLQAESNAPHRATALRGLHRLQRRWPELGEGKFIRTCVAEALQSTNSSPAERVVAAQICAVERYPELADTLKAMAQGNAPLPVRLACIRAVGAYDRAQDTARLRSLAADGGWTQAATEAVSQVEETPRAQVARQGTPKRMEGDGK